MAEAPPGPPRVTAVPTAGLPGPVRRVAAGAGSLAVLVGAVTMAVALVAAPGPWTQGYVSEAGTEQMPAASAYRWGLLVLALGVTLLGAALAPVTRVAAVLLAVAGALAATTAAVPCSGGCPLPPYETGTVADVVHTGASILGMVGCALAMLVVAAAPTATPALRWVSAGTALLTIPIGVVEGLGMLLAGRGPFTAQVERLLLVIVVGWLVGVAALAARHEPPANPGIRRETVGAAVDDGA